MSGPKFNNKKSFNYIDQKEKIKKGTMIRLVKYFIKYKYLLLIAFITFAFSTVVSVSTGLYLRILIDDHIMRLLNEKALGLEINFNAFYTSLIRYALLLISGVVSTFFYQIIMATVGQRVMKDIREQMFDKMEKLPIRYFDTNGTGDVMARYTSDLDTLRQSLTAALPQALAAGFAFITIFISMLTVSINLVLCVILVLFIMVTITKHLSNVSVKANIKAQSAVGDLNSYVEEMINGAKEVKLFCYEDRNIIIFNDKNLYWKNNVLLADTISNIVMPLNNGFGNILYIMIALVGGLFVINNMPNYYLFGINAITLGAIATFLSFTKNVTQEIANISMQIPSILQCASGANRIFNLLDETEEVDNGKIILVNVNKVDDKLYETNEYTGLYAWKYTDSEDNNLVELNGHIVFNNVCFSYDKKTPILKNINLYARRDEKVALVGKTGAGKTTITNLINRFYDIDSGEITYDGINIKDIKKSDLRKSLSIVLQDVQLFSGTILDNIKYGNLNATKEDCIDASKKTFANSFIEQLEYGYDTILDGNTAGLSQGQKQLLSISRAYVANPQVMILDEATSNIDTRTEKLVQDGTDSLMKGRTVFVIAHRLSTIKNSDVIMVMDNGEIIERGNHKSLMDKKGMYYKLFTGIEILD